MRCVLDLRIDSALVVDGSGEHAYAASVGIDHGVIATIERTTDGARGPAATRIDARGLVLTPGFIDVHNHSDAAPFVHASMTSALRQGVTTVVVGNCGMSPFPLSSALELAAWAGGGGDEIGPAFVDFADFLDRLDATRPAVNLAALIGHGSVRELTIGPSPRAPDDDELASMCRIVDEAMEAGAIGLSTGLIYAPGIHAATDEVVALAARAGRAGGLYASHIRGEGRHLFRALDEAIAIGRRAAVPVHISHLKCESASVWGRAGDALARVHEAGASADQYPYTAWASTLASLLPPWAAVGDLPRLIADPATRTRLVDSVERGEGERFQSSVDGVGWDRIVIEGTADTSCNSLDIATIGTRRAMAPVDAFFELLIDDPATSCIGHAMDEQDVRTILADPRVMVASDAVSIDPDGPVAEIPVHPRTDGTFPRVAGPTVRGGLLTLEAAVRSMTSLPADRFGLAGRGRIAEGAPADLVVFDPATVADRATFAQPHLLPEGFEAVIVAGRIAWRNGHDGIERAGRVLRRGQP
jgi:dihydroorotase/N-acyl-D-amino-acid deacylase